MPSEVEAEVSDFLSVVANRPEWRVNPCHIR
jgi:hypothetical protein